MSDVLSGAGVPTNDPKNIHDMTAFIQQSLTDMQGKFTNMSDQVHRQIFKDISFSRTNSNIIYSYGRKLRLLASNLLYMFHSNSF